jgi:hypothetical protein
LLGALADPAFERAIDRRHQRRDIGRAFGAFRQGQRRVDRQPEMRTL